jgi:uncharacterized membrane protein/nitrite reductase/ring-hydroxylating ferredoxin subunit
LKYIILFDADIVDANDLAGGAGIAFADIDEKIMKSRASFKSHPLHPILVVFPIAFFTGTLIFDILSLIFVDVVFWVTAKYMELAGIIGAVMAAIPGLIDYLYTVPPKSSGKKRAAQHGLINSTALIFFTIAWLMKKDPGVLPAVVIILEVAGIVLLSIGGWLGGTLVYRNQIGVDPRYAHAGKWKELYIDSDTFPVEVATAGELKINQMKLIHVQGKRIVLGKTEKGYMAFDDRCTHRGGSLAGGAMICETVQCPWHGSQFDVSTGVVKAGPAKENIRTYSVNEVAGKIMLTL